MVTAAGGKTGTAVVRALRARGEDVRAVVGSARPRPALDGTGAEVVVADLVGAPGGLPLAGADALYLIWPNVEPSEAAGAPTAFRAAADAGVGRVVYHSVLRPQLRSMPHHAAKDRAEEALDGVGVPWRVLQPCAYADNFDAQLATVADTGELRSPWGLRTAQSLVDLRDVAEAAVVLLTEDGLDGGTFEAVGPQPLTAPDLAAAVGTHLGRPVTAVDSRPATGEDYAGRCLRTMFDWYRAHGFTGSPRVLTTLLGRPPRTFADHLAALTSDDAGLR
ncbi:SDR family oxidoreductase [Modestobacter sp. Leaf380]|uniref:SDR family oxidoreductase n=1 Tax=Modestobacter sp. Leaf380 TaxID=1736356 RepID=UPI001F36D844|nr:NmrA family NAD(P)-binding protein [Modestobacter sp. Leaf380]